MPRPKRAKSNADPKTHYLPPKVLKAAIDAYKENPTPDRTEHLGSLLTLLATNLLAKYGSTSYLDDQIQDGIAAAFEAIPKIDTAKGNPFSYLTTTVLNASRHRYRAERHHDSRRDGRTLEGM